MDEGSRCSHVLDFNYAYWNYRILFDYKINEKVTVTLHEKTNKENMDISAVSGWFRMYPIIIT